MTRWSDGKLVRKEARLRTQCGTLYSISQHSATWWLDGELVRKEAGLRAQHRTIHCATTDLQQEDVKVRHGVAEVALDVGHGLTLDLDAIPHPHPRVDLRHAHLHKQFPQLDLRHVYLTSNSYN